MHKKNILMQVNKVLYMHFLRTAHFAGGKTSTMQLVMEKPRGSEFWPLAIYF